MRKTAARTFLTLGLVALGGCDETTSQSPDSIVLDAAVGDAAAGSDAEADWYWPKVPDAGPGKKIGEPCKTNTECADKICVEIKPVGQICTRSCKLSQQDCPQGFYCAVGPFGSDVCVPGAPCSKPDAGPTPDAAPVDAGPASDGGAGVLTRTPIGSPQWEVTDLQFVAAPGGFVANNNTEGLKSAMKILSKHIFFSSGCYGFGPDPQKCHSPKGELAAGAMAAGYALTGFTTSDLVAPKAIHFLLTLSPKDEWGPSPCSSCEPVIPDSLFDIAFDGDLYRDGTLVDKDFDGTFCPVYQLAPGFAGKNFDHLHLAFLESSEFITPAPGTYELKFKLTDAQGKGWNVSKSFVVTGSIADAGVPDGAAKD
jgi:hypothetical protein